MKKKLVYIGFAFPHHAKHSGYHQIKKYLNYDRHINCQLEYKLVYSESNSFFIKVYRRISKLFNGLTNTGLTFTILRCILLAMLYRNHVFHFVYAENTYKWLHKFKGRTNKIVCTYHLPSHIIGERTAWKSNLKYLDKVILMTKVDLSKFNEWAEKPIASFIPHGIDTKFYSPLQECEKPVSILMVGSMLRDFDFANSVFNLLFEAMNQLNITVVTKEENFHFFNKDPRLNLLTGISDMHLRDLYRSAKCLFLPLKLFTANNAILEALSAGCPIVVATDKIDPSYSMDEQIDFLSLNRDKVCDHLIPIIKSEFDALRAEKNRAYVVDNYSWEVIADRTKELLKEA